MGITTFAQTMTDDEMDCFKVFMAEYYAKDIIGFGLDRKRVSLNDDKRQQAGATETTAHTNTTAAAGEGDGTTSFLDKIKYKHCKPDDGAFGEHVIAGDNLLLIKESSMDAVLKDANFPAPKGANAYHIGLYEDVDEEDIGGTQVDTYWIVEYYLSTIVDGKDMVEEWAKRFMIAGIDNDAGRSLSELKKEAPHLQRWHGPFKVDNDQNAISLLESFKAAYQERLRWGYFVPYIYEEDREYFSLPSPKEVYSQVGAKDPTEGACNVYLDKASETVVFMLKRALQNKGIVYKPYTSKYEKSKNAVELWECFGGMPTDYGVCYGPANMINSFNVCKLDHALQQLDDEDFLNAYTPDADDWPVVLGAMTRDNMRIDDDGKTRDYIMHHWQEMKVFVRGAAVRGNNIIVHYW